MPELVSRATAKAAARIVWKRGGWWQALTNWWRKWWKVYGHNWGVFGVALVAVGVPRFILLRWPLAGAYLNAVMLAMLVALALMHQTARQLAIAVAIIPTAMMISLVLPPTTVFAQTVVFYSILLVLGLIYRFMFSLDFPMQRTRLKWRGYLWRVPLMLVLGQVLGTIGYAMLRHHYPFGGISLPLVSLVAVVFGLTEEIFFRGLIQQRGTVVMHPIMAAVLSALLFTMTSVGHFSYLVPLFAFVLTAAISITYYLQQNLVLTMAINIATKLVYIGLLASFTLR